MNKFVYWFFSYHRIPVPGSFVLGLFFCLLLPACRHVPGSPLHIESSAYLVHSRRDYAIRHILRVHNYGPGQPDKQNLWVALIRDIPPYQELDYRKISPADYKLVVDEYGNEYAEFDLSDHPAGTDIVVEIEYHVRVNELSYEIGTCEGSMIQGFTEPELRIESANPQIISIYKDLSRGAGNVCEQVRRFYEFVADELVYSYNRNDWGAQAALGPMGADCTEYSSLMIALSRAAGIPARYFEGLLYLENDLSALAQTEHAWLDVYLPGVGWVAADPTLGRSASSRDKFFAHYTPEHIIITMGRNPSTLRGSSYWSHLYWPGDSTKIQIKEADWQITPLE